MQAQDWQAVNTSTAWIRNTINTINTHAANTSTGPFAPWFVYTGMLIVHPPYVTTGKYVHSIRTSSLPRTALLQFDDVMRAPPRQIPLPKWLICRVRFTLYRYFDRIPEDKVDVPEWAPLSDLHPCDLQSSMLKGCTPSTTNADAFYSTARRRRIRRIYLSMIAEFDEMVGRYIEAVEDVGATDNTIFIVPSHCPTMLNVEC